ncbi:MAG: hypothetical protein F4Y01_04115, partial [Gammaproteobacteria bacterium]|nr:hypothetical protein [Gammaproteobacteria bacterium]
MNLPTTIKELEDDLARVRGFVETNERAAARSDDPLAHRVFLASNRKLQEALERALRLAKSERAYEVICLRLHGTQMSQGSISLRALGKIVGPLNAALELSAWRAWDVEGHNTPVSTQLLRQLDLRLAGIETGSTELIIIGNTSPDLAGSSPLEDGLRGVFALLQSPPEDFAEHVHSIGLRAGRSLAQFTSYLCSENIAVELDWSAPERRYSWDGRPDEIVRVATLLEEIGEPDVCNERVRGRVNVLSVRGRLEVEDMYREEKVRIQY